MLLRVAHWLHTGNEKGLPLLEGLLRYWVMSLISLS